MVEDDERQEDPRDKQEDEHLAGPAEVLNLEVFDPERREEILVVMKRKFRAGGAAGGVRLFAGKPPPPRLALGRAAASGLQV